MVVTGFQPDRGTQVHVYKNRFTQVSAAQVGFAQVGTAQVGSDQVGASQVGTHQIGMAEVSVAQVSSAQVDQLLYILIPPEVPCLNAGFEDPKLLQFWHDDSRYSTPRRKSEGLPKNSDCGKEAFWRAGPRLSPIE
jgi:hypothetical protein